jgi:hypothetical protein
LSSRKRSINKTAVVWSGAVFKFLKDSLGWEQFQVQDFESIANLIALCFFVGQYFFELEPALADHHPVIASIAQLGGGKGKVTRHYFLKVSETI